MKFLAESGIDFYAYKAIPVDPASLLKFAADLQGTSDRECVYNRSEVVFKDGNYFGFQLPAESGYAIVFYESWRIKEL